MSQAVLQNDIFNVVVQLAFWVSVVFPIILRLYWPWNKLVLGRAMVALDILVAGALLPSIAHRLLGITLGMTGTAWFDVAVIALIPVRTVWLGITLFRIQNTDPSADFEETEMHKAREIREAKSGARKALNDTGPGPHEEVTITPERPEPTEPVREA